MGVTGTVNTFTHAMRPESQKRFINRKEKNLFNNFTKH